VPFVTSTGASLFPWCFPSLRYALPRRGGRAIAVERWSPRAVVEGLWTLRDEVQRRFAMPASSVVAGRGPAIWSC